ncbi:MAG TPA: rhodanese-like domain-containing protein [Candidatus Baltobacteraceae bacterium]
MSTSYSPKYSAVSEFVPVAPDEAIRHFEGKLKLEVDPADVHYDNGKGVSTFVVIDTRSEDDYRREHIPGAISLPHRKMDAQTTKDLPRDRIVVTYCWGTACNASTKGALQLARLGFQVKEMIGGIEGWKSDGYSTVLGS